MASPTQWTWVWVSSRSWWWTGKSGGLQSIASQRGGHNWATELDWFSLSLSLSYPVSSPFLSLFHWWHKQSDDLDKCKYPCNPPPQGTKKTPLCFFLVNFCPPLLPRHNHCFDISASILDLSHLELHKWIHVVHIFLCLSFSPVLCLWDSPQSMSLCVSRVFV